VTPADAIAKLDGQIAKHGQTVTLTRGASTITLQAFVRAYQAQELVGPVQQGDTHVSLSPSGLGGFPLPVRQGDKAIIAGATRNIENAEPVRMQDILVRINLRVRG